MQSVKYLCTKCIRIHLPYRVRKQPISNVLKTLGSKRESKTIYQWNQDIQEEINNKNYEQAMFLFHEMGKEYPYVNASTLETVLKGFISNSDKIDFIRTLQQEDKLDGNLYRVCIRELCVSGCHEEAFNIFKEFKNSILVLPPQNVLKLSNNVPEEITWSNVSTTNLQHLRSMYRYLYSQFQNHPKLQHELFNDMKQTRTAVGISDCLMLDFSGLAEKLGIPEQRKNLLKVPVMSNHTKFYEFVEQGNFKSALKVLETIKNSKESIFIPVDIYNKLLGSLKNSNEISQLYYSMRMEKVKPNIQTYKILIQSLLERKEIIKVMNIIDEMATDNILPDESILDGIVFDWNLNTMMRSQCFTTIIKKMKEILPVNPKYWRKIVYNYLSLGQYQSMFELLIEMKINKIPLDPTLAFDITSSLVDSKQEFSSAELLFLLVEIVYVNKISIEWEKYHQFINLCAKSAHKNRDYMILRKIIEDILHNTIPQFRVLLRERIHHTLSKNQISLSKIFYPNMNFSDLSIDYVYIDLLEEMMKKDADIQCLESIFNILKQKNIHINDHVFEIFCTSYAKTRDFKKAIDIWKEMEMVPSPTIILNAFAKLGDYNSISELQKIFKAMSIPQIEPACEFSLLEAYARCGYIRKFSKCLKSYLAYRELNSTQEKILSTCIMEGYIKNAYMDGVLKQMKKQFPSQTQEYNLIMEILLKNNFPNATRSIFNSMLSYNVKPNLETIMILTKLKQITVLETCLDILQRIWNDVEDIEQLENTTFELFKAFESLNYIPNISIPAEMGQISQRVYNIVQNFCFIRTRLLSKHIEQLMEQTSYKWSRFIPKSENSNIGTSWRTQFGEYLKTGEHQKAQDMLNDAIDHGTKIPLYFTNWDFLEKYLARKQQSMQIRDLNRIIKNLLRNPNALWACYTVLKNDRVKPNLETIKILIKSKQQYILETCLEYLITNWKDIEGAEILEDVVFSLFFAFKTMNYFPSIEIPYEMTTISDRVSKIAMSFHISRRNDLAKFIQSSIAGSSIHWLRYPQARLVQVRTLQSKRVPAERSKYSKQKSNSKIDFASKLASLVRPMLDKLKTS